MYTIGELLLCFKSLFTPIIKEKRSNSFSFKRNNRNINSPIFVSPAPYKITTNYKRSGTLSTMNRL